MKIINLLYFKYAVSLIICLFSCFVIFFIFSLISYLNEEYLFYTILNLSILNSFQILTYVPSIIFLISLILFSVFLRSRNEVVIIKSYLSINKFIIFFLPIILIFSIVEINKKRMVMYIEDNKLSLIKINNQSKIKILINKIDDNKTITIFNNLNLNDLEKAEYRSYNITNKEISTAEFSNKLLHLNNTLILENYTQYKDQSIKNYNSQKIIYLDINDLMSQRSLVKDISTKNSMKLDIKVINLLIFFIFFLGYIFLNFFNSEDLGSKKTLKSPILISLCIIIYTFLIFNNSLSLYKQEFELLGSMIVIMLFFKSYLNE